MKINDGCVPIVIGAIYRQANGENTLKRNRVFLLLNRWSLPLKISITYYIGIWTGHKGHPKNFLIGLKIVKNTLLWFVLNLEIFRKKKISLQISFKEHFKQAHPNQEIPPSIKKAGIEKAFVTFIENSTRKPHECPYCPMEYAHRTKLLKHCKGTQIF